jgi:hypothetical protein
MHSVNLLFTKFTLLFTIHIPRVERYQSNFTGSGIHCIDRYWDRAMLAVLNINKLLNMCMYVFFSIKHTSYDLFTKVTFLFTIQISQAEKYQSRFAASPLK